MTFPEYPRNNFINDIPQNNLDFGMIFPEYPRNSFINDIPQNNPDL